MVNYVASFKAGATVEELAHHGVKGMKWGVRRDERALSDSDRALNMSQRSQVRIATTISALAAVGMASNAAATLFQLQKRFEHLRVVKELMKRAENSPLIDDAGREGLRQTRSHIVKGLVGSAIGATAISAAVGIATRRTAKAYFAPLHKVYGDEKGKINRDLKKLSQDIKDGKRPKLTKKAYEAEVASIVARRMTKNASNVLRPFHELARSQLGTEFNTKRLDIKFEKLPNTELYSKMTIKTPTGLKLVKAIKNVEHADMDDEFAPDLELFFDYKFDSDGHVIEWSCPTIEIANDLFEGRFDVAEITRKYDPESNLQHSEKFLDRHDTTGMKLGVRNDSSPTELIHYGVKGMKWGVRNDQPGSKLATHRAKVDAKHLARDKQLSTKGARLKRGLVTDFTLSPYRSAGRIRRKEGRSVLSPLKPVKFEQLTGKQQSKLQKSLARDLSKLMEKKLPKEKRGKTDYLKMVKSNPKLRDSLVRQHAGLMKFGHRNTAMGESRKKYLFTQTNWPRLLPIGGAWGVKTSLALNTLGISALATRAISRHSSDISELDYVGTDPKTGIAHFVLPPGGGTDSKELLHYGVKGMRWGIRNDNSGSPRPTRARVREDRRIAKADQADAIRATRSSIASGETTVVRNGKILSTKQALKTVDREAEKLTKRNPVALQREEARRLAQEQEKQQTLAKTEESIAKFNRLETKLKTHGIHSLQDDELKFVNSRNEALKKAKDAYAKPKSWLRQTVENHAKKIASEALLGYMTKGFKSSEQRALVGATRQTLKGFDRTRFSKTKTQRLSPRPTPRIASNSNTSTRTTHAPSGHSSYTRTARAGRNNGFGPSTALVRSQNVYAPRTGTAANGAPIFNVTSLR